MSNRRSSDSQARGYRNAVPGFLLLPCTLDFVDLSIIAAIGQPIKVNLLLFEAQLGLLGVFAPVCLDGTLKAVQPIPAKQG